MKLSEQTETRAKLWPGVLIALSLITAGCASSPDSAQSTQSQKPLSDPIYAVGCSTTLQPEHQLELDLVDSLMGDAQSYAALAQLESMSFDTQYHWLRWAQLLAQVDQVDDSEDAFRAIVHTCGSYEAHHGLGVVLVKQGELKEALNMLATAKDMLPAASGVRNDLGYALMLDGQYGRAAFELRTAYELAKGKGTVKQNMIAAYYLNGGEAALSELRRDVGLREDDLTAGKQVAKNVLGGRP